MTVVTVTLNPCIYKTVPVERVVPDCKLSGLDVQAYPGGGDMSHPDEVHELLRALTASCEKDVRR